VLTVLELEVFRPGEVFEMQLDPDKKGKRESETRCRTISNKVYLNSVYG